MPFLQGEAITARPDLKSGHKPGAQLIKAAHAQPSRELEEISGPLSAEFERLVGLAATRPGCAREAPGGSGRDKAKGRRRRPAPGTAKLAIAEAWQLQHGTAEAPEEAAR